MRTSIAVIAAAYCSVVVAQIQGLPNCAQSCANSGLAGCGIDVGCICGNQTLIADLSCCVAGSCSSDEQQQVIDFAVGICRTAGITTLPTMAGCATTSMTSMVPSSEVAPSSTTAPGAATTNFVGAGICAGAVGLAGWFALL
ncbi:hypothetical protein EJ05DRAFT_345291 [Pseudovirgaria hyperparasitica]|uniref:CFEM domain-containing protein n=1 Tax=Pseudovirgaria hyperparasitica TaxID=470096 RepID=A0A6A6WBS8_9PEZI|nr:uncharacterized protein EJ05DRAFT_345291 [Pseudovirgaria hyperparasitica]KAF2759420.1 hypothetical protein EJ05DRAFT_345291 [Pseudovirgaria hyperparasitica]